MEQLLGQMTQLLEQTQVQQQQLQGQQRQAEEQTAQLIERLGEQRANYDNDGGERRPYQDQLRRPRVEALKEGEDIEKFFLTFERQMIRAGIGEDECMGDDPSRIFVWACS